MLASGVVPPPRGSIADKVLTVSALRENQRELDMLTTLLTGIAMIMRIQDTNILIDNLASLVVRFAKQNSLFPPAELENRVLAAETKVMEDMTLLDKVKGF